MKKSYWYLYLIYNKIKHFWKNAIVDRLNRHGVTFIQYSDERIKRYAGRKIYSKEALNNLIIEKINSGEPFLISRLGGSETKYITAYTEKKRKQQALDQLCELSGFFPNDIEKADQFAKLYIESIEEIDVCGIWRYFMEDYFLYKYAPNAKLSILEWLEPWRSESGDIPWSSCLKNKKVLIIHPFVKSIEKQYMKNREKIFSKKYNAEYILPNMQLITMESVQSLGGGTDQFHTWFEALDYMKKEIEKREFDIAIIGCGAYGLPLAAHIKKMGKQAIHLGGATQLMFGIMGKRWNNVKEVCELVNDSWIRPSDDETPKCASKVEGGCYW